MKKPLQVLTLLGTLGLSSCIYPKFHNDIYENYRVRFEDYTNTIRRNSNCLYIYSKESDGYIYFSDHDGDLRLDSLSLVNIKRGDAVEQFACLKTGQKIIEPFINRK